ncbi:hypothetical protein PCANC_15835 [Puccinia coronata f. sp. avenae]|uniref:Uncharacterized protein n=1 Tax=Puccinia coronata f. sp. avenae TaxID=200324 RepID=A0A2N5SQN3_9BASI|nr:hypothetical protein PCANC_15835 [Puccinia coronata f. sp. avenae]
MPAYWRYRLVGLFILCFLGQCCCTIPLADGSIICWSDSLSDSSIKANGQYFPLEFDDVKSKAKQISEETLKQYLATIPQFYQHPSTVFTGLDHKNEMEHGYIRIKEGLRRIRKECDEFSRKTDGVRKLSKDIKQMEDFQKILSMGIEHKILGAKGKNTCFEITGLCPDEASLMTSICIDMGEK